MSPQKRKKSGLAKGGLPPWDIARSKDGLSWSLDGHQPYCSDCMLIYAGSRLDKLDPDAETYQQELVRIDEEISEIKIKAGAVCDECREPIKKKSRDKR